jgi:hypothetical protein
MICDFAIASSLIKIAMHGMGLGRDEGKEYQYNE